MGLISSLVSPAEVADYIDHKDFDNRTILYENDLPIEKEGYLTDLITDYTVDFISKKHDKPFFISLQYTAPHWPWQLPGESLIQMALVLKTVDHQKFLLEW